MIVKGIRHFDEGGSSDSGSPDSGSTPSYSPAADSQAAYSASDAPSVPSDDGQAPAYNWGNPLAPMTESQLAGGTENAQVPALAGIEGYNPDGFTSPGDEGDGYGTSGGFDPNRTDPGYQANWSTWDKITDALPSWKTVGNVASAFVPALRPVMMAANAADSINKDSSISNILGTLATAPVSRLTGLNSGAVSSLFHGDVGGAAANQVVGTAMGDLYKAVGPEGARALGLANTATGASGEANRSLASAINNAINDRSTSVTQAQGLTPGEAAQALQGRGGNSGMLAGDTYTPTHSNPVAANIASILGVKPVAAAAKGKKVPIDIVQQLMAMQNLTGNLESVPAKTGGSIDDLIRLTRS